MYNQIEKQKFVTTMVNNVGYYNKQLAIKHILQFLQTNKNFNPRETVRTTQTGSFLSFVEITGFVQIGKNLVEMYIGVPIGYPKAPPVFLLANDRNLYIINQQQKLLSQNLIANQKNQSGQDFIRLRFPFIQKQWNPRVNNINSAYNNLIQVINRPPLMVSKNQENDSLRISISQKNIQNNNNNFKRLNSNLVTQTVSRFYGQIAQLLISKQSLQEQNQAIDYLQCREAFLQEHLPALKGRLEKTKKNIDMECENIKNDIQVNENSQNCDKFLQISQIQRQKLDIISEQQALKEAQVKLRSKMENSSTKFSQYKKIMKVLYEKMFDNQSRLLRVV